MDLVILIQLIRYVLQFVMYTLGWVKEKLDETPPKMLAFPEDLTAP